MAKISVVIPLYNKEYYIERAIDSVLKQTMPDFELIVVDDGSTDRSSGIVKQIKDERVRLVAQTNQGETAARNKGINEARCSYIAFLDADDAWKPLFLETVLRLKNNYSDCGAYATAYEVVFPNKKTIRPKFKYIPGFPWEGRIPNYFKSILGNSPVCSSAVLIPKKVFEECGFFPAGEKLGGDSDMWFRIAMKYPIAFSNSYCAVYYKDALNRSSVHAPSTDNFFIKNINNYILGDGVSADNKKLLQEYIYKKNMEVALYHLQTGNASYVRKILKDCHTKYFKLRKFIIWALSFVPQKIILILLQNKNNLEIKKKK